MKADVLVAEIGSTTTVVNAFNIKDKSEFLGSGQSPTTVNEGDVNIGLKNAVDDLCKKLGADKMQYDELLATSSAAGGLKMTVHGLVYDMTVRAAKEAALGAGANIHMITAGRLTRTDLEKIKQIRPNIMLLAGGVNYGERETAIYNAELIAGLHLDVPVIYAGNVQNQDEIRLIFEGSKAKLYIVENVYPKIDQLNVEPARKVIQDVFEEHITHAPGMGRVRDMVNGNIIPTPAGVMEATKVIAEFLGDVVTVDVGGATTDIHSVTEGSEEISRQLISPEPHAKRTVEGDLGVYVNASNLIEMAGRDELKKALAVNDEELDEIIAEHMPIPITDIDKKFTEILTSTACKLAMQRHAGEFIELFSTAGKRTIAQGKDLTAVKYIIGTGGALTRLPGGYGILRGTLLMSKGLKLMPKDTAKVLLDADYIMASLGVLSKKYKEKSIELLKKSLRID
ncbi:MAG: glutamate mutase L [Clostridia bacterium]|nr:glutamate mutase L [Clostridia bacterium]